MPGLQGENVVAALGSPIKKSKLSLKFFQKKEAKRALDFSEPQADEAKTVEPVEPEARWVCAAYMLSVLYYTNATLLNNAVPGVWHVMAA